MIPIQMNPKSSNHESQVQQSPNMRTHQFTREVGDSGSEASRNMKPPIPTLGAVGLEESRSSGSLNYAYPNHPIPPSPVPSESQASFSDSEHEVNNPNWDAYWYYYWYWANYWRSMGYDYPPSEEYDVDGNRQTPIPSELPSSNDLPESVRIPSKSFKSLQKDFSDAEEEKDEIDNSIDHENTLSNTTGTCPSDTRNVDNLYRNNTNQNEQKHDWDESCKNNSISNLDEIFVEEPPDSPTFNHGFYSDEDGDIVLIEEIYEPEQKLRIQPQLIEIDRLSTIEELSETEPPESEENMSSSTEEDDDGDEIESNRTEENEDSMSEQSSNESVIENNSFEKEKLDDICEEPDVVVTIRLPQRPSFVKSKSYRDVATVLVESSEVDESSESDNEIEVSKNHGANNEFGVEEHEQSLANIEEHSTMNKANEDAEIDFWAEINDEPSAKMLNSRDENVEGNIDRNFWDMPKSAFMDRFIIDNGNFELTDEYMTENKRKSSNSTRSAHKESIESDPSESSEQEEASKESSSQSSTSTVTNVIKNADSSKDEILQESVQDESTEHVNSSEDNSPCTCHVISRISETENLFCRIERFLQLSFTSLGSEDSGVLTDHSRYSDAETDNEDAASLDAISTKESGISIFSNSENTSELDTATTSVSPDSERRIQLSYQRAKTHSRLFQLLQEECEKEEKIEEEHRKCLNNTGLESTVSKMARTHGRSVQGKDGGLSIESNGSSGTGTSGLLSPVNRDQMLLDLINEFQSRHHIKDINSFVGQRQISISSFPSKIFKMLCDEFGEEFYDAFEYADETLRETIQSECAIHKGQQSPSSANNAKREHCQKQSSKTIDTANIPSNALIKKDTKKKKHQLTNSKLTKSD